MTPLEPDKKLLRRRLGKLGQSQLEQLLLLQEADMGSKGTGKPEDMAQFDQIRQVLSEVLAEDACFCLKDLAINGRDLQNLGFIAGPKIGKCLIWLLEQVQDEALPNEQQALLLAASTFLANQ